MKLEKRRRRTGMVARLPREARDHVNEMLDDGCTYGKVVGWLEANGHPGLNEDHVREWKGGGFQDWVELERELARQEKLREVSYDIATANEGSKTQEAAIQIAANFLFQVFMKFDPEKLAKELDLDPKHIPTVLNAFSRINRRGSELEILKEYKRRMEEERKAAAIQATVIGDGKAGISDDGEEKIERDWNLT